jgi:hypothetical protein
MPKQSDNNAANVQTAPAFHLVVVHPFGQYEKGAHISAADEVADVLAGENAHCCNRVAAG